MRYEDFGLSLPKSQVFISPMRIPPSMIKCLAYIILSMTILLFAACEEKTKTNFINKDKKLPGKEIDIHAIYKH